MRKLISRVTINGNSSKLNTIFVGRFAFRRDTSTRFRSRPAVNWIILCILFHQDEIKPIFLLHFNEIVKLVTAPRLILWMNFIRFRKTAISWCIWLLLWLFFQLFLTWAIVYKSRTLVYFILPFNTACAVEKWTSSHPLPQINRDSMGRAAWVTHYRISLFRWRCFGAIFYNIINGMFWPLRASPDAQHHLVAKLQ